MPDYGEEPYAKKIAKKYEHWSVEDLHRQIDDINTGIRGLELAKNHLESLIRESYSDLNELLFELMRRTGA